MAGNEYHQVRPQTPQDRNVVAAGSPLAVLGIFLEALRERFREDANVQWVWRLDNATTDLLIELGYNTHTEAPSYTRALFINRLSSSPATIAVGDRAGVHLPDHLEGFVAMMTNEISIDCVAVEAGDSMLLADIVQHFVLASGNILEAMFGFHDVSMPMMGQTAPFTHDQEKFSTPVTFAVQYHVRWTTVKIRPLLQQIVTRVADAASGLDATGAYVEAAVTSLSRRPWPLEAPYREGSDSEACDPEQS